MNNARDSSGFLTGRFTNIVRILVSPDVKTWSGYRGTPSHPVLFARETWPELMAVGGDTGARDVLKAHPDWVVRVELDAEVPEDLDTMEDYERMLRG